MCCVQSVKQGGRYYGSYEQTKIYNSYAVRRKQQKSIIYAYQQKSYKSNG